MANYQNNMRYGRQNNMRQMRPACGNHSSSSTSRGETDASCRRFGQNTSCHTPNTSWTEPGCNMPVNRESDCKYDMPCPERVRRDESACPVPNPDCGCATKRKENSSHCDGRRDPLSNLPLAMAYVPWQSWCDIYDICEGYQNGTIFEQLNKPFLGIGGRRR